MPTEVATTSARVGARPELSIRGERFVTFTRGREFSGSVPAEVIGEVRKAGLPLSGPFAGETSTSIAGKFAYLTVRLHKERKLEAVYSVHDLRHAFALRFYTETKDIYATSKALGHAWVSVTEKHLKSLGMEG